MVEICLSRVDLKKKTGGGNEAAASSWLSLDQCKDGRGGNCYTGSVQWKIHLQAALKLDYQHVISPMLKPYKDKNTVLLPV